MNWNSSRESNFLEFKLLVFWWLEGATKELKENQKTIIKIKTKVQSGSFENPKKLVPEVKGLSKLFPDKFPI
jgi:hypothetical protein